MLSLQARYTFQIQLSRAVAHKIVYAGMTSEQLK